MNTITTSGTNSPGMVRATATLAFAVAAYLVFFATFLAFIAFVAGVLPPIVQIDASPWQAAVIDLGLVVGFGLQHSVMARQEFKRVWTRVVPEPVERAAYVLAASLALGALVAFWQSLPGVLWTVHGTVGNAVAWSAFAFGWATVLFTTFLIDHCELFGLRQAWAYATGRTIPQATFKTPNVYRLVRHPMQLGFIIAFWAAPVMTLDRFAVAALLTGYIVTALIFEERDLVTTFGDEYRQYQKRVPRLLPRLRSR